MKIINKIVAKADGRTLPSSPIPTIAFLGDSVTQGCFEEFMSEERCSDTVFDQSSVYHNLLKQMLNHIYPKAAVSIINAGISGDNSTGGLSRLERDVLSRKPDLTVVCFALNDSTWGMNGLERYENNLRQIFQKLQEAGSEVIFMTPNMLGTRVLYTLKFPILRDFMETLAKIQNEGILDAYVDTARKVAKECSVPVCDVYAKWKKMASYGTDTTLLLCDGMNHPIRPMHWLFAHSLLETMFEAE
ncbi:MAG: GDSL family lipase [Clostridia bacterium]|nr:GDSL family lipase [Clostridia bacterium]